MGIWEPKYKQIDDRKQFYFGTNIFPNVQYCSFEIGDFGLATTELLGTGPTEDFR